MRIEIKDIKTLKLWSIVSSQNSPLFVPNRPSLNCLNCHKQYIYTTCILFSRLAKTKFTVLCKVSFSNLFVLYWDSIFKPSPSPLSLSMLHPTTGKRYVGGGSLIKKPLGLPYVPCLTLGRTRAVGGCPPHKVFLSFYREDKNHSAPDVFSSCSFISRAQWWSVAMVTKYDVISSRWWSHFLLKVHVFSTFFNSESKSCG